MKRIVIIGKTGQVAVELQRAILPDNFSIIALGRDDLDLTRSESIIAAVESAEPDVIINAAAYTNVDRAEQEEELAFQVNSIAPGLLAKAATQLNIPFIHLSTDYVFDGHAPGSRTESDETVPRNVYGRSKLAGERAVMGCDNRVVVLRTAWVFSSYGSNFVKTMLQLGSQRREVAVVDDQNGGPTAADDIASVLLRIAANFLKGAPVAAGTYHFMGTPAVSRADFAEEIFRGAQWLHPKPVVRRIKSGDFKSAALRPLNSVLDCGKIKYEFGIEQPDWRPALSRALKALEPQH